MKQKPPSTERRVLTWARDRQGIEDWMIDSYNRPASGGDGFWFEAHVWEIKVLWWQELPPRRDCKEE